MSKVIKSVKENKSILTMAEMKPVIIMKSTVTHIVIISEIFGDTQKHLPKNTDIYKEMFTTAFFIRKQTYFPFNRAYLLGSTH